MQMSQERPASCSRVVHGSVGDGGLWGLSIETNPNPDEIDTRF